METDPGVLPTLSSVNGVELAVHLPAFLLGCPILVALITLSINFTVETNTSHGSPCGRVHTEAEATIYTRVSVWMFA